MSGIAEIPPQSILAGKLHRLRQKRKRMSKQWDIELNMSEQRVLIAKLTEMGREDLTR